MLVSNDLLDDTQRNNDQQLEIEKNDARLSVNTFDCMCGTIDPRSCIR
jgi:hypothetical protein